MGETRLSSIAANRHLVVGRVNGRPLRLLLAFEDGKTLRLLVAGDGERMIVDGNPLDAPFDRGEYGRVDAAEVTDLLFPTLRGMPVSELRWLLRNDRQVGVRLDCAGGAAFHFWVDGDELSWGDESKLISHDWLDGIVPKPSQAVQLPSAPDHPPPPLQPLGDP